MLTPPFKLKSPLSQLSKLLPSLILILGFPSSLKILPWSFVMAFLKGSTRNWLVGKGSSLVLQANYNWLNPVCKIYLSITYPFLNYLGLRKRRLKESKKKFLQLGTEERNRISLVAWEKVCRSVKVGGLGIRKIKTSNRALLTKIGWQLSKEEKDWTSILRAKYLHTQSSDNLLNIMELSFGSSIWNNVAKTRKDIKKNGKMIIGNGKRTAF